MSELSLAGTWALQFGREIAAPRATRLLGDFGVEVLKTEAGKRPDFGRTLFTRRHHRSEAFGLTTGQRCRSALASLPGASVACSKSLAPVSSRGRRSGGCDIGQNWPAEGRRR